MSVYFSRDLHSFLITMPFGCYVVTITVSYFGGLMIISSTTEDIFEMVHFKSLFNVAEENTALPDVVPIFISVDPHRDSVKAVAEYVKG